MIMELEELKLLWSEYDRKLDKNLQLNMQLLRKMNFDKARLKVRLFWVMKVAQMVIYNLIGLYLIIFAGKNLNSLQFSIPAAIVGFAIYYFFALDLKMLELIEKMGLKNNAPIAPLVKKTECIKLLTIRYVKYSLFAIPGYPVPLLLFGKIIMHIDFLSPHFRTYFLVNVILGLIMLPFFVMIYRELSKSEIEKPWVRKLLCGSGFFLANDAEAFLKEVAKFEEEPAFAEASAGEAL